MTLSIVKLERQLRRLFTHLVFQCDAFDDQSVPDLLATLEKFGDVNVTGFIKGIDALAPFSVADMVGETYGEMRVKLKEIYKVRNKVFHGQLSGLCLDQDQLLEMGETVRRWCKLLATGALDHVGYDGFERDSFRKSDKALTAGYREQFDCIAAYKAFIRKHVAGTTKW
ncbi:hypothetical protein WK43_22890 [Burkholderia ubonensis]|nr:hypothetical protein WK37_19900 [Burkholderia ubonensis]KVS53820.1 hypothetical protein WK38_07835 [Burkholderia ubonensis]KVS69970.1 hypothetical protein WK42_28630 [Burkholderia ubonensis]KVS85012.1 hypothetical protein WK43_22890 [Burkholderia ubonensis]KVS90614.1 hypothetical protein WK45_22580 [Burkholderia ubonensis]